MKTFYPPVGIAHITSDIVDLLSDRLINAERLRCAVSMQPKSNPHFGTMIVMMVAFAVAKRVSKQCGLPGTVLIDVLENAPARMLEGDGREFAECVSHAVIDERSAADTYMQPVISLAQWLEAQSGTAWAMRPYRTLQALPRFREGLVEILRRPREFGPLFSPSDQKLRIRPMCERCGIVDKRAVSVVFRDDSLSPMLTWRCPTCGDLSVRMRGDGVIDCNAPVRTVLRTLCFIQEREEDGTVTVVVNGGDWAGVWMQRVYFDGLSLFQVTGRKIPMNMFAPLILDESGAKLSKTMYLEAGAYASIDKAWLAVPSFRERYGERGLRRLWEEVESWVAEPRRFFRDYSVAYFMDMFRGQ